MHNDKVDILLAAYNGFPFIACQLESILGQNHKNIHILVRDDLSTDSTRPVLETYARQYPEKITLLPSDRQLGVKGNFSCLMEHSKANYIMFSDQDDIWEEGKVCTTLEKMKELERQYSTDTPLLVHTDLKVVDRDLNILCPSFWNYLKINPMKGQTLNRLLMQNVVTGCTALINRSLLQLGAPIPEGSVMHDWWLALVAAAFGQIAVIPKATMLYRQHGRNALGAQKFLSYNYIKQGVSRIRTPEAGKQAQAQEMLMRYFERLSKYQKKMLKAYQKLLILKYRFFKIGFLRNMVNIFAKKQ
jgi:glycosyltransferase involved in cell wall biosynthesis